MPDIEGQFAEELKGAQPEDISALAQRAAREAQRVEDVAALRKVNEQLRAERDASKELLMTVGERSAALESHVAEKDVVIRNLQQENERKDALIHEQLQRIEELSDAGAKLRKTLADAKLRESGLEASLSQADTMVVELQRVIKNFEEKAVFEWPKESKLSPELRKIIIGFLEQGDMGGLENLLDRLIRYDDKLPTLLKHTYFKEKVEELYGRYFKRPSGPTRRAADTIPGIPLSGPSGSTTMGFGPSASTLGILFIDLDDFKRLNDTKGHLVGDAALKRVAEVLNETLRQADIKGRFGGEELEVALELETPADGLKVAQKVVEAIRAAEIEYEGSTYKVTASVGVAELQPGEDLRGLIGRANWAMKYAKHTGKNRFMPAELEDTAKWVSEMKAQGVQIPDA